MRKFFALFALVVISLFSATSAFSQKAERVIFKRGARAAIVTGNLYSYKSRKVFLIRVRRGQTLRVEQIKPDASLRYVTLSITAPNGEDVTDMDASCNNRKRVSPTRVGDYRIEVYECQKAKPWRGRFTLKFTVR